MGNHNVESANQEAAAKGLGTRVRFERADAKLLPAPDGSFDAVICECAFCTFPNKTAAANEFVRVLGTGGQVGLSDLTRVRVLPKGLDSLLAWVACVADAQPIESYAATLRAAGLMVEHVESHVEAKRVGTAGPSQTAGRGNHGGIEETRSAGRRLRHCQADGEGCEGRDRGAPTGLRDHNGHQADDCFAIGRRGSRWLLSVLASWLLPIEGS